MFIDFRERKGERESTERERKTETEKHQSVDSDSGPDLGLNP